MKYEATSNSISGDVLSDFMTIIVLMVDDTTQPITPDYIIENGIIEGKFEKGTRWEVLTDSFNTFPGSMYIMGVYNHNQCRTNPLFINLPLNSCISFCFWYDCLDIIGNDISFDATYVNMDGDLKIIMRGNSILETQYYLLYKDVDSYVLDSQLFTDDNYVGLYNSYQTIINRGKNGQYFIFPVNVSSTDISYAYVGCRIENYKSNIVKISLDDPIMYNAPQVGRNINCKHTGFR